jgi:catechol 2,3-dioxygenase
MAPQDPEELEAAGALLPAPTTVGAVHLTVADLDRSIDHYVRAVGLDLTNRDVSSVMLGSGGRGLLCPVEEPGAEPARGHTGLDHFALLLPARFDLARWLAHAVRDRVALVGLSDISSARRCT